MITMYIQYINFLGMKRRIKLLEARGDKSIYYSCKLYIYSGVNSCITAHPINAELPFLALFLASTTMASVKRRIHTFSIATNSSVLALVSTHTTVQAIGLHIDTFLIAAVRPGAALPTTNPRKLIACYIG
jgi:hypothetical protein